MKPNELLESIKKEKPELLSGLPDKKAVVIIRLALAQLAQQIDALEDGALKVPGLGIFQVRQVEREKDGQKVFVKRIVFRAAKGKSGEEH